MKGPIWEAVLENREAGQEVSWFDRGHMSQGVAKTTRGTARGDNTQARRSARADQYNWWSGSSRRSTCLASVRPWVLNSSAAQKIEYTNTEDKKYIKMLDREKLYGRYLWESSNQRNSKVECFSAKGYLDQLLQFLKPDPFSRLP
jgi:hypothetical protein